MRVTDEALRRSRREQSLLLRGARSVLEGSSLPLATQSIKNKGGTMDGREHRWEQLEIELQQHYEAMAAAVPKYHYCGVDRWWHRGEIDACAVCVSHKRCLMDYQV